MSEHICPHCHNPIYDDDALLCHFCGESLMRPGSGLLGRMKYSWGWVAVISTVLILIFPEFN